MLLRKWRLLTSEQQTFRRACPTKWRKTANMKKLRHCHPMYKLRRNCVILNFKLRRLQQIQWNFIIGLPIQSWLNWTVFSISFHKSWNRRAVWGNKRVSLQIYCTAFHGWLCLSRFAGKEWTNLNSKANPPLLALLHELGSFMHIDFSDCDACNWNKHLYNLC